MPDERKEFEELTIKFGKGLAEDFTGKDGKAYKRILIPNTDPADRPCGPLSLGQLRAAGQGSS